MEYLRAKPKLVSGISGVVRNQLSNCSGTRRLTVLILEIEWNDVGF